MFIIFVFTPSIFFNQKSQNFNTELLILKYHLKTKLINFMNFKFLILKKEIECGRICFYLLDVSITPIVWIFPEIV